MKRVLFGLLATLAPLSAVRAAEPAFPTLPLHASAPDFDLPGVDGKRHALKDFAGAKILVVIFTCNHCPSAQYYEDRIKQLVVDYRDKGVAVVAIMPNDPRSVRLDELGWTDLSDSFAEMKIRADFKQFNFPYLYDGDAERVAQAYGPVATPHVFIFDPQRKLRYQGGFDDSEREQHVTTRYVRDALEALLAGREPPRTKTKVVGCSIKWAGKSDSVRLYMEKLAAEPVTLGRADPDTLKALRKNDSGKFRLVNFWATWCPSCLAEFHEFVTMNRMYRHRDFELITVSVDPPDKEASVLAFLKKQQASCKNLIFASAAREPLINAFDPDWPGPVPYTVLLDPQGKFLYRQLDSIDAVAIRRAVVKAMNAVKPW